MSYDDIQNVWKSPGNRPSAAELEQERLKLVHALQRERRRFWTGLIIALLLSIAPVIVAVVRILSGRPFDLSREWGVILAATLPWIVASLFIRRQLQHRRAHSGFEQSVSRSLRAMLDANLAAQHRARIVLGSLALDIPVMGWCLWQLQAVGKARPHEAASLGAVMAVAIGAAAIGTYRHYRRLLPKEQHLAALVAELE